MKTTNTVPTKRPAFYWVSIRNTVNGERVFEIVRLATRISTIDCSKADVIERCGKSTLYLNAPGFLEVRFGPMVSRPR